MRMSGTGTCRPPPSGSGKSSRRHCLAVICRRSRDRRRKLSSFDEKRQVAKRCNHRVATTRFPMMHVSNLLSSRSSTQFILALRKRFGPSMTSAAAASPTNGSEELPTNTSRSMPPRSERHSSRATSSRSRVGHRKSRTVSRAMQPVASANVRERKLRRRWFSVQIRA